MDKLSRIKELIFASDNKACFIERERILNALEIQMKDYTGADKYAIILSELLSRVSTPVLDCDYFAGRVVEALPDSDMQAPNNVIKSTGHMSFDYEKVLRLGLKGILEEIRTKAAEKGDRASAEFAKNAEIVIVAVDKFAKRYAEAAWEKGFDEMAKALEIVPFEPAYDFYSALQGIWIIHMIASCYVGARDYAFGRFDKYMLPFYQKAINEGKTKGELTNLLAGFLIKTNEICGTSTHNYNLKPVLCQSSNQYINIGGETPNEFSSVVLEAAKISNMAQPQIVVLLDARADENFTKDTFEALSVLNDKMNIYNYEPVVNALVKKGIDQEIAKDFTYSACCTFDLNFHSYRQEYFVPAPQILIKILCKKEYNSLDELIDEFKREIEFDVRFFADEAQKGLSDDRARQLFVFDSLFLSDSASECRYACDSNAKYNVLNVFFPGIATIGDSLMVIDKLVFKEKRYGYKEFIDIVKNDFEGNEKLLNEILGYTKFGNDTEADDYAVKAGNILLDAADSVKLKDNFYIASGFYSLERDNSWSGKMGATPDGRRRGQPFSENQSPTYGADKNGITALLKSLSKLPFGRTVTGGLNITFSQKISPAILQSLIVTYFKMGGLHVGISVVDKDILKDAMATPEKYKSLTVRLYGFSEYFVSLPKWQQIAVLNRTDYK